MTATTYLAMVAILCAWALYAFGRGLIAPFWRR